MDKKNIREIVQEFSELMLKNRDDVQFIKIIVGLKNKTKIKFKKYVNNN